MIKKRVAVFRSLEYKYDSVQEESYEKYPAYARISEYVTVEFPDMSVDNKIANGLKKFEEMESKVNQLAHEAVMKIQANRQEWLALPAPEKYTVEFVGGQ